MTSQNRFSSEVSKQLGHYVYRLIDPRNGDTFYVGKGQNNRVFEHAKGEPGKLGDEMTHLSEKLERIREIRLAGLEVQHVIHRHGLDEKVAVEVEGALIDAYPGLTNLQDGQQNSLRGAAHSTEILKAYTATMVPDNMHGYRVMEITINRSAARENIDMATRFSWRVSQQKANSVDLILAVISGLVVEVFNSEEWLPATPEFFPELFEGRSVPERFAAKAGVAKKEVRDLFIGSRMPKRKPGAANPIRYFPG